MLRKIATIFAFFVLLIGIGVMLYPAVSNLVYERRQKELQDFYNSSVTEDYTEEEISDEVLECQRYNASLLQDGVLLTDPFDSSQLDPTAMPYAGLLRMDGEGAMGWLEIPSIDLSLMIYHGTTDEILSKGVGHMQGTSLPVGGTGTHCVLSAHTGMPGKKLFTDLDQVVEGDIFYLHTLNDVLAYRVDSILVVLPDETDSLKIDATQDYVTLVTCTPYGINSHRLLVRGTRIPYEEAQVQQTEQSEGEKNWFENYLIAVGTGVLIVILLGEVLLVRRIRSKRGGRR